MKLRVLVPILFTLVRWCVMPYAVSLLETKHNVSIITAQRISCEEVLPRVFALIRHYYHLFNTALVLLHCARQVLRADRCLCGARD